MLADTILKIAEAEQDEAKPYRRRPSSAGPDRCIRSMVYHALGYPAKPLPGRTLVIFDDGKLHEEATKRWLRKRFIIAGDEKPYIGEDGQIAYTPSQLRFDLSDVGLCPAGLPEHALPATDWITIDPLTLTALPTEHKGINGNTWDKYEDFMSGEIPHDYLVQTTAYMYGIRRDFLAGRQFIPAEDLAALGITALNFLDDAGHIRGILLIKNKNTSAYLEYSLMYEHETDTLVIEKILSSNGLTADTLNVRIEKILGKAREKFDEVEKLAAAKVIPARPYCLGFDWQCNYCGWSGECWAGREDEIAAQGVLTDELYPGINESVLKIKQIEAVREDEGQTAGLIEEDIREAMFKKGVSRMVCGDYNVELKFGETKRINKAKIPADILQQCTDVTMKHKLSITKAKTGKGKK